MKRLHLFLIKSFLGPFIATFFIAIFLLLMQFLWKYIDDLVGKGLDFNQNSTTSFLCISKICTNSITYCHAFIFSDGIWETRRAIRISGAQISRHTIAKDIISYNFICYNVKLWFISVFKLCNANCKFKEWLHDI